MADDFGSDIAILPDEAGDLDITAALDFADGNDALVQNVACSLASGGLGYAPHWGIDLERFIASADEIPRIAQQTELAAVEYSDGRVRSAYWQAARDDDGGAIEGPLFIDTLNGPFSLTIRVDQTIGKVFANPVNTTPTDRRVVGISPPVERVE